MAFTKLCATFTIFINLALCVITHDQMAPVADLDKGPLSENTLRACIAAPNCGTYRTDHGTMIRFIPEHEPGSADFIRRFVNRTIDTPPTDQVGISQVTASTFASVVHSNVDIGHDRLNYGDVNPIDIIGVMWGHCDQSACDTGAFTADTHIVGPIVAGSTGPTLHTITLTAQGQYDGWDQRAFFVHGILAAAGQGQRVSTERYRTIVRGGHGTHDGDVENGKLPVYEQSNFYSINRFDENGALHGFMSIRVDGHMKVGGACGPITALGDIIAGLLDPLAGAFLGTVNVFCTSIDPG